MQLWLPARDIQDNILNVRNKLQRTASISSSFNSEIIERIIDAEISDLINGDIPYFWIDGLTGALNHSTGLINNSYANNVLKNFDSKFRLWSNRESSRNMNTIIKKLIQKDKRFL
jgi:lantibiotic modifying enzyme